jgi:hypothetical protein
VRLLELVSLEMLETAQFVRMAAFWDSCGVLSGISLALEVVEDLGCCKMFGSFTRPCPALR